MYGSRYEFKGEIASAETKSVNEVRYIIMDFDILVFLT